MVYGRKGKTGTTWYIEYVDGAGRRRREATTAATRKQAELLEAELRVREERRARGLEPHDRNPQRHTVESLVGWYLKQTAKTANARHLGHTMRAAVVGDFAATRIDDVTAPVVRAFLAAYAATDVVKGSIVRPRSASTVNRLRAYLSGMFRAAIDAGLLVGENPVRGTKALKTEAPIPRALPADVVAAILDNADRAWRLPVAIAAWAGLRYSEIARLRWADVDLVVGVIYVGRTKAKKGRVVPIHPQLQRLLEEAKASGETPTPNRGRAADAVRRAMLRAGVVAPEGTEAVFHSLRGAWASQWVACGADVGLVEFVGWGPRASSVMQTSYLTYPVGHLRAEILKLSWAPKAPATVLALPAKAGA